jgi:hypothetical protein
VHIAFAIAFAFAIFCYVFHRGKSTLPLVPIVFRHLPSGPVPYSAYPGARLLYFGAYPGAL